MILLLLQIQNNGYFAETSPEFKKEFKNRILENIMSSGGGASSNPVKSVDWKGKPLIRTANQLVFT